jgi:hypothetical protein
MILNGDRGQARQGDRYRFRDTAVDDAPHNGPGRRLFGEASAYLILGDQARVHLANEPHCNMDRGGGVRPVDTLNCRVFQDAKVDLVPQVA